MAVIGRSGLSLLLQQKGVRAKFVTLMCILLYAARKLSGHAKYEEQVLMVNMQRDVFDDIYTMY